MDPRVTIRSQYRVALEMLEQAVVTCPEPMWNDATDLNRFWSLAYHAVFFTERAARKPRGSPRGGSAVARGSGTTPLRASPFLL